MRVRGCDAAGRRPAGPSRATAVALAVGLAVVGCSTNPYTGRSQLLLLPESFEVSLGQAAFEAHMEDSDVRVSRYPWDTVPVRRVGERIVQAALESPYAARAERFQWNYTVIRNSEVRNAWALPGGQIGIYTGMFSVAETEAGLAVVMGHEVAHALARHGSERMSRQLSMSVGTAVVSEALGVTPEARALAAVAFGLTVSLPFSRLHESEADYIGLLLAAEAGYDPREAVAFWERMEALSEGRRPEFLSTHPSHDTRAEDLWEALPEALAIYERVEKAPNNRLRFR